MITLVISDLHIGDPRANSVGIKIAKMLEEEQFDCLVLNGDIFDLWLERDERILSQYFIVKKIIKIAKTKPVYWVKGNHDNDAHKVPEVLPGSIIVESVDIINCGKKIHIAHGHQICFFKSLSWHLRLITKINAFVKVTLDIDLQHKLQKTNYWQQSLKKQRGRLLEYFNNKFDYIISGHTHLVGYCSNGRSQLYDIGSGAFTKTYAIIENGHISLKKIQK